MKKYIVHIYRIEGSKERDIVLTLKCRNSKDLENIIEDRFYDVSNLDGYDYEEVKGRLFRKNDPTMVIDNWVGAETFQGAKDEIHKNKQKEVINI